MLPSIPNFEDYSDSGLAPGTTYSVFMPILPAVDTVRSVDGLPLIIAEPFSFTTVPQPLFIEARRPLVHTSGPPFGMGDEDGCINNPGNEFFGIPPPSVFQFGTDAEALLLCIKNEGPPRILSLECSPAHDQRAVGTPSASAPGTVDMGAIRVVFNEPLDPISVVPYVPTTQKSINVQLWLVGDTDANPVTPVQVATNKPLVVQSLGHIEVILSPLLPQPQGTYVVNVQGIRDLAGNALDETGEKPATQGGYLPCDNNLVGKVPPGYRIYYRTLILPATNGSFTESFGSNFNEATGDEFAGGHGARTFTMTSGLSLVDPIPGAVLPHPGFTLTNADPGQSTTGNWNGAYLWLGLPHGPVNELVDDGLGRLKAVFQPHLGNGSDGNLTVSGNTTLSSAPDGLHPNGRIYQYDNVTINAGATLTLQGDRPVVIKVRNAFVCNGTIQLSGQAGRWGIDTDGSANYTHVLTPENGGPGGLGGPGGGNGGHGSPKVVLPNGGDAAVGVGGQTVFTAFDPINDPALGFSSLALSGDTTGDPSLPKGGGGAGHGTAGSGGSPAAANGGSAFGTPDFSRALARFIPDREFQPNAEVAGGAGGGGGGGDDDNGASETGNGGISTTPGSGGDDGGGGGGGGGGCLWLTADTITLGSTCKIFANGGRGGNTYAFPQQLVVGPPGDEYVFSVIDDTAAGTGQGGGGGGGSGGGVLLQGRSSVTIDSGAEIQANGGPGGTTGGGTRNGGAGGAGAIGIVASSLGSYTDNGGVFSPALGISGAIWQPTIDMISQGVSKWYDLTTGTADFKQPFYQDNFLELTGAPHNLIRGLGGDFEAIFEVQGCDGLSPNATDPTSATAGLTPWTAITFTVPPAPPATMAVIDNKRFVRWRWRFFVAHGYDQTNIPMPAILDFTLPFQK
jgi:hypothetical protein